MTAVHHDGQRVVRARVRRWRGRRRKRDGRSRGGRQSVFGTHHAGIIPRPRPRDRSVPEQRAWSGVFVCDSPNTFFGFVLKAIHAIVNVTRAFSVHRFVHHALRGTVHERLASLQGDGRAGSRPVGGRGVRVRVRLGEVIGQRQRVVIVVRGRIDKSGIRDTRHRPREGRVGLRRGAGLELLQAHCCCCWQACRVSLFFSKHLARAVRCGAVCRQASRPPLLYRLHRPRHCTQVVNSSSSSLLTRSCTAVLCSLTDVHSCLFSFLFFFFLCPCSFFPLLFF